jgi:hypothetical protein
MKLGEFESGIQRLNDAEQRTPSKRVGYKRASSWTGALGC